MEEGIFIFIYYSISLRAELQGSLGIHTPTVRISTAGCRYGAGRCTVHVVETDTIYKRQPALLRTLPPLTFPFFARNSIFTSDIYNKALVWASYRLTFCKLSNRLIPHQYLNTMASLTDHGFLGTWVQIAPSTIIINFFRIFHVKLEKFSPRYTQEMKPLGR